MLLQLKMRTRKIKKLLEICQWKSKRPWLDDRIINHAQELIKRKYKDTDGLQDTTLQRFDTVNGKFIQVLHVNNNPWLE